MNQITSKKVTRWYLNGKGYASKKMAYKKLAYQYLLDEVLGKNIDGGRVKLKDLDQEEAKSEMIALFADKFPHEVSPRCYYDCFENEGDYIFDSCKAAQKDWINNKVEELYEA